MSSVNNPDIDQELLQTIKNVANISQASSKLSIAIYCAFVYNFIATIRDEIDIVWGHKWSIGSVIYSLTRYLALVSLSIDAVQIFIRVIKLGGHQVSISVEDFSGHEFVEFEETSDPSTVPYVIGLVVLFSSMVLLQLRTSALYGNPKFLLIGFGVLDLLLIGALILLLLSLIFNPFIWIPLACVELITLIITLWKTYKSYRYAHGVEIRLPLLLKILLRDNIFYLLTILVFYLGGTVLIFVTEEFANPHFEASVAISGVIAPWLYVHLRKSQMMPTSGQSFPSMHFEMHLASREREDEAFLSRDEGDPSSSTLV